MKCTAYKTEIVHPNDDLLQHIFSAIPQIPEQSVLCITSKIAALCEGSVIPIKEGTRAEKHAVVAREADYYLPPDASQYNLMLTIKHQVLAVNAGVDESNVSGVYALLPKDPYGLAVQIWKALKQHYKITELGVVITDSRTIPLKWGSVGTALGHCGFVAINSHIGEKDLLGRELKMTTVNVAESLAEVATFEMGESAERQPLAIVTEVPRIVFQAAPPTAAEIQALYISRDDDVYAPILSAVTWQTGGRGKS
ncbi:MAG: coenzyme F420-0:L-glutamate ligase [bacterium]|nr:coenzyme F420-0:L-glutamate ligase [bacterium]